MGPIHCQYNVTIDYNPPVQQDAFAPTQMFQQLLFANTTLPMGLHTVTLTNDQVDSARTLIDLDYVGIHWAA